jgi:hypothetical protein
MVRRLLAIAIGTCLLVATHGFQFGSSLHTLRTFAPSKCGHAVITPRKRLCSLSSSLQMQEETEERKDRNPMGKAVWYAAEALGDAMAVVTGRRSNAGQLGIKRTEKISRDEALDRLRVDYDRSYFVSGELDIDLYEQDCLFAGKFLGSNPTLCQSRMNHGSRFLLCDGSHCSHCVYCEESWAFLHVQSVAFLHVQSVS